MMSEIMTVVSIDGACRRNGKPDCVAAAGIYIQRISENHNVLSSYTLADYEIQSTNQRGELLALLTALTHLVNNYRGAAMIITDSEYLFNAMTKGWYKSWCNNKWLTSTGSEVKNRDLWEAIVDAYEEAIECDLDISFYHIKGHCIPFGKVTANGLLNVDRTGMYLFKSLLTKYDSVCNTSRQDALQAANELSEKNNGFKLDASILRFFVCMNCMADAIATQCVETADALM